MHPATLDELLIDGDPDERHAFDESGRVFYGIPVRTDESILFGQFQLRWP